MRAATQLANEAEEFSREALGVARRVQEGASASELSEAVGETDALLEKTLVKAREVASSSASAAADAGSDLTSPNARQCAAVMAKEGSRALKAVEAVRGALAMLKEAWVVARAAAEASERNAQKQSEAKVAQLEQQLLDLQNPMVNYGDTTDECNGGDAAQVWSCSL